MHLDSNSKKEIKEAEAGICMLKTPSAGTDSVNFPSTLVTTHASVNLTTVVEAGVPHQAPVISNSRIAKAKRGKFKVKGAKKVRNRSEDFCWQTSKT